MWVPILDGATLQQRWVIRLLWSEMGGTLLRISVHYAEYRITQRKTYQWYDSKLAQQVSVMKTGQLIRPLQERRTMLSNSVRWYRRKGGWLSRILQTYWVPAVDLHILCCTHKISARWVTETACRWIRMGLCGKVHVVRAVILWWGLSEWNVTVNGTWLRLQMNLQTNVSKCGMET